MNDIPDPPIDDRDSLDRLLESAVWPEPTAASLDRLREQWLELTASQIDHSRRLSRRVMLAALLALSATVLIAVGLGVWNWRQRPAEERIAESLPPDPQSSPSQEPVPGPAMPSKSVAASRAPTAYERVLIVAARRQSSLQYQASQITQETRTPPALAPEPIEILPPAVQTADASTLGRWIQQERDPPRQRELLAALLARDDPRALPVFLQCVQNPRTSQAALDCLRFLETAPWERLFEVLKSPNRAESLAAAQALGGLDRPEVSQQLIGMVRRGAYRQQAMVALLASCEPMARQFLASAERNASLAASLRNAKHTLPNLSQWRSCSCDTTKGSSCNPERST